MIYNCLTVGNSVIDTFLTLPENQQLAVNRQEKTLCVPYGAKIEVERCEFLLGGNAANVAVGLRRAGFVTSLIAEIADDEFSEKILHGLKKEQVDIAHIVRGKGQSSFSIALNFKGERTLFVEHQDRAHDFHFEHLETQSLYLTSLGHKWEHVYSRVAQYLQANPQVQLAFNPGSLQIQEGLHSFSYLLPLTALLFLNKEEAEHLIRKQAEVKELLPLFKAKGVQVVVITDGERGSYCIDAKGRIYHQESLHVPVVERTGAGDAYATGFIAGFLRGLSVEQCLLWGTHKAQAVAARTYGYKIMQDKGYVLPSQSDQVVKKELNADAWIQAVNDTAGQILTYNGAPIQAWFSSTAGGYTFSAGTVWGSDKPWTKNGPDATGSINSWSDLNNNAYDKQSPWFYCDWGGRSQYAGTAWLKPEELADIANVILLARKDSGTRDHLYQTDKANPKGTDTWNMDRVKQELKNRGGTPYNTISSASVGPNFGSGTTSSVTLNGDAGSTTFDGNEFENFFNLRAPANINIVGPLYNIEQR